MIVSRTPQQSFRRNSFELTQMFISGSILNRWDYVVWVPVLSESGAPRLFCCQLFEEFVWLHVVWLLYTPIWINWWCTVFTDIFLSEPAITSSLTEATVGCQQVGATITASLVHQISDGVTVFILPDSSVLHGSRGLRHLYFRMALYWSHATQKWWSSATFLLSLSSWQ